jgi:CRISPR-associated endonuclease/helicase Cas3
MPTLVINIAGTGCGKTRMNVRAIASLRPVTVDGVQEPVRIAAAMNLRTLTLQTRDAYAEQLGLKRSELACVLGSQIAIKLHSAGRPLLLDDDENEYEDVFDFDGEVPDVPPWLKGFLEEKPVLGPLIMSPVVVSTVDFLINAGEPHKQGNHGLAMLRAIHSDLILDEVDAYDTKALAAVARLVTAYAMWGRHVVASSATLSPPVAKVLFDAFALGIKMWNAMQGTNSQWRQAIIEDRNEPTITSCTTCDDFLNSFNTHIKVMMSEMGQQNFRPAELQAVSKLGWPPRGAKNFLESVQAACTRMHQRHRWQAPKSATNFSGRVSFGLVRVANIKTAMLTARSLANSLPDVRVCCYHSQVGLLQRWNIERTLDSLLTRKDDFWMQRTVQNPYVLETLNRASISGIEDVTFIVVATPVEEVGRDHDFDWAVIEPSSSQSIVQTVGRVNRHRLLQVDSPNVAVLQYNFRTCTQVMAAPVFCKPGLETEDTMNLYADHNLADLLDWTMLSAYGQIDARLRYQSDIHAFANADNVSLVSSITGRMDRFLNSDKHHWLMKDTYLKAPLRDKGGTDHLEFYRNDVGDYFQFVPSGKIGGRERSRSIPRSPDHIIPRHQNNWLVLSIDETKTLASEVGIRFEQATSVQISSYDDDHPINVTHDESFGYRSQPAKY